MENGAESTSDPVMGSGPLAATVKYFDSQEITGENGADTAAPGTIRCSPTTARYLRLRILTEAGNRGPWTSAAELTPLGW
ncbi:hypothetical protein [Kitasatospora sp. NPDC057015]|uniref:hypothetical protein n=1 Tax=Kitasatospora sp. NPDC057015 TaxID=3346001 RepID=UPI0036250ED1